MPFKKQLIAIGISLGLFALFTAFTFGLVHFLNSLGVVTGKLTVEIIWAQVLLGVFIYLKTAVDYALFVGSLMERNTGLKKRIIMNIGTSVGCFIGVTIIAVLWTFFKEIHWLMAILLIIAAMILWGLGDNSQEHFDTLPEAFKQPLARFFDLTRPLVGLLTFFMPEGQLEPKEASLGSLFILSMIIPFALGADDLAGYMALLTPVSLLSLLIGIYLGDAIIDIALFANPELTVKIVKNRWVAYIGALFFIGLGALSIIHAIGLYV